MLHKLILVRVTVDIVVSVILHIVLGVYTNMSQWYVSPVSIQPVGGSDYNCIILL